MSDARPIGVFDSGIGFYLGDTARVPYGGKSASTVERYSLEIAEMLMEENAKTVVVACNTASSVALAKLEKHLPVPVIGVIRPGARAALATTRNGHVGVIGTRATIKSGAYERELRALNPQVRVSVCASPLLVPLIEEGWLDDELTDRVIARYLGPLVHQGIDTLVLGCTHYPLLVHAISRALPKTVSLVDSARNCAMAVKKLLVQSHLSAPAGNSAGLDIALTDAPDIFLSVARRALRLEIGNVQLREVLHSAPIAAR